MASFPGPRRTTVGIGGKERAPIKTVTTARYGGPQKTVVGSTARAPIKTTVGRLAAPPRKTLVGSTARPPLKTTPGNLGTGGKNPLDMAAADRGPINAANPVSGMRPTITNGNRGTSVSSVPAPAQGPPNPTMNWAQPWNVTDIEDGGMGPTAKRMGRAGSGRTKSVRRSAFYGE